MITCHPAAKSRKRRKDEKHIPRAKRGEKKYLIRIEMLLTDDQETCFVWGCPSEQDPPD